MQACTRAFLKYVFPIGASCTRAYDLESPNIRPFPEGLRFGCFSDERNLNLEILGAIPR